MSLEFREREWGTADGRRVKFKDMDLGHLVNVLNWTHDHERNYPQRVRDELIKEAEYRKLELFASGQKYPRQVGKRWEIIDPATGTGGIEPPPADYIEAVKDNDAYQRMAKVVQKKRTARRKADSGT